MRPLSMGHAAPRLHGGARSRARFVLLTILLSVASFMGSPFPVRAQLPGPVSLQPPVVSAPVRVSGPSPLQPGCEGPAPASRIYRNSVAEPSLVIDPGNPLHLIGAWQQDRWATAGAAGQVATVSWDGGQSWISSVAAFARCQGGTAEAGLDYERISDPWLTISPNGDVYQMTIAFDNPQHLDSRNAMLVSKSVD